MSEWLWWSSAAHQGKKSSLLELFQAQCYDHFPAKTVPLPNHPLGEELFSDIQSELPITASCHSTAVLLLSFCWSLERRD